MAKRPSNKALAENHAAESRREKMRRWHERWSQTPQGRRAIAISEEFSVKWRRELAELETKK
jgi:hypothetical protein